MSLIAFPLVVLMLIVVGFTVVVVKAGAIALRLTGLDESRANFQALSAVTGTGFTTRESELVVSDPQRRRIIGFLMVFGNVVIVALISLLVGSFASILSALERWWFEVPLFVFVLIGGGFLLYLVLCSGGLTRRWSQWVNDRLMAHLKIRERPVAEVLALAPGYGVAEIRVDAASPCVGKPFAEAGLRGAGLLVLAIRRGDDVLPTPTGQDRIETGDRLVCYGELERMHTFSGTRATVPPDGNAPSV